MKRQLLIPGGTGLIGQALQQEAEKNNWEVLLLSRRAGPGKIQWTPSEGKIDLSSKMKFDAIVNLTGESIGEGRWTKSKKKEIYDSRIKSAKTLENYLFDGRLSTEVYLGASAVGIYGDKGNEEVTEETPPDTDYWLSRTVIDWEAAHRKMEDLGIRTIILRNSLEFSIHGGALTQIIDASKFGVMAYFGDGSQIWPWIHIDDMARLILFCIEHPEISGTFLAASPQPVPNKTIIKTLNACMPKKRIVASAPKFILGLVLGEMHRALFDSIKANPQKILNAGFQFRFPTIESAARDLCAEMKAYL